MNYNTLRTAIAAVIKTPANPQISGAILQQQLIGIVNALDLGALYLGMASTNTVPSTEANGFYFATTEGTYTNFLNSGSTALTVSKGEIALFVKSGNAWAKEHMFTMPYIDSTNKHWIVDGQDSGVVAEGQDGANGITPHIDPTTGNWFIGTTDTGVHAQGPQGHQGSDGHNPNLGTFTYDGNDYTPSLPLTAQGGDYIVIVDLRPATPKAEIYTWDGNNWSATGYEIDYDSGFSPSAKTALVNLLQKVAFVDEHGQEYFATLYRYLLPTVVSINAVFTQGQAVIYEDDDLEVLKQYLVITALYQDSSTRVLQDNEYTLSGVLSVGTSTITANYGDKSDTFSVTVTATTRERLFGVFSNGYAVGKGYDPQDQLTKISRTETPARATTPKPFLNKGFVFSVTDPSKYNLAAYDVQSLEKQTSNVPQGAVDGYYYLGGDKTIAWQTQDSVSTRYVWLSLKKLDGTAFTAQELADGAAAVFTYTSNQS